MSSDLETDKAAARALFLSLDAMEGLPQSAPAPAVARSFRFSEAVLTVYPGALVATTIGLAAMWLSQHYSAPVMLFALLIGLAFHFLHEEGRCVPGIEFCSKAVLRLGVALLGARITATQILSLGLMPIFVVMAGVVSTILFGALLAPRLGLSRSFGLLSGGAVGICGASAALAIASVLPKTPTSERDTIFTVVTVTALSTIAMIIYPMLVTAFGLDHRSAGIFLGGTIHDVAQVVGAGYTISPESGDIATYVKLLRVTLLAPAVFAIAMLACRSAPSSHVGGKPVFPLFLIGFAALVILNSLSLLPNATTVMMGDISRGCLVTAIAALGMKTSFKDLATVGWRPVALVVIETTWIAAMVLSALWLLK